MPALRMDPHKVEKLINLGINSGNYKENIFDTGDYEYEYINPGKEGMIKVKEEFLELNANFMPPSAQITPKKSSGFDSLVDFIFKYVNNIILFKLPSYTAHQTTISYIRLNVYR